MGRESGATLTFLSWTEIRLLLSRPQVCRQCNTGINISVQIRNS